MHLHPLDTGVVHRAVLGARVEALDRVHRLHARVPRWPKTVCLPSSHGAASVVTMKNWLPFVSGPRLAMASAPRTILCSLISSSNS